MDNINDAPLSAFKQEPFIFHENKTDYLEEHLKTENSEENVKKGVKFMETNHGNDAVVEGIITLWKVND